MGNCSPKAKSKPRSATSPPPSKLAAPAVRLYGSESCPSAAILRLALIYKSVRFDFVTCNSSLLGRPFLQCGADTVVGDVDALLRGLDSRFPHPQASYADLEEAGSRSRRLPPATVAEEIALATALHHRSMERHVQELAKLAAEMAAGGSGARREAARLGRSYAKLVEVLLEHAQMEERLLFPALEAAADEETAGVCKVSNEEHARDLPIINGIKEDIKSMVVMEAGTTFHQEALLNLSIRFKILEEHLKEHFHEEERKVLPQLEMAIRTQREEENYDSSLPSMEQLMGIMEATHSARLFPFLMAGLVPEEALRYVALVCRYTADQQRLSSMLGSLVSYLEAEHVPPTPVISDHSPLKQPR